MKPTLPTWSAYHQPPHRPASKCRSLIWGAVLLLTATAKLLAANQTFTPGAYIIDMGVVPQTAANGLKPFGLLYSLIVSNEVPISWAINPNKVTDKNPAVPIEGVDFIVNSKSYRGGPFIIPSEQVNPAVTNLIAVWRAKGVVVDGPINQTFTAPIYETLTSFPNVLLDLQNGSKLISAFYAPSEVPTASYLVGNPNDVGVCHDVYAMPHADPQNWDAATRAKYLNFVLTGGYLWGSCHAVSAIEGSTPSYLGFNFLSTTSLIPWGSHINRNTTPFVYNTNQPSIWGEPIMQFIGKVDLALQGGSEEIFVPDSNGWAPHAKVAVYDNFYADPRQPWISHSNPSMAAAEVVYGRAFNNTNYGVVIYVGSHAFQADGEAQNTAVGRIYANSILLTGIERRPTMTSIIPSAVAGGDTVNVSATVTGPGAPFTIVWSSSLGGTFGDPNATNTTFTAPVQSGNTIIKASVVDSCGRKVFTSQAVDITAAAGPGIYKTASWTNSPGFVAPGERIDYQIKMDNYTNLTLLRGAKITDALPPHTTYVAASANPPLSSGPDPLVWNVGTNFADIPGVVSPVVTNTISATTNTFDAYIDNQHKDRNYGGATNLVIGDKTSDDKRPLVRFDLSSIPTNVTILSADLVLTKIGGASTAARNISVHRLTTNWTENTLNDVNGDVSWHQRTNGVNWTTQGGDFVSAGEVTNSVGTANGPYAWNVTSAILSARATPGPTTTNGFLFRYNMANVPNDDIIIFGSSENVAGNGPKLLVAYTAGVGTTTRITTSPYKMIGSQNSLPSVDVTMEVSVFANPTNLTVTAPTNLTLIASGGATATKQASYPSPASAIVPAGGGTVTFTYKYDITSLGTAPGSLSFRGRPANAGGATYADATSNTILTVPTLNYTVQVNAPLPVLVQQIPNTATFSDTVSFPPGINDVTSAEVVVPVDSSLPDIGIAKAATSIVNIGDGRHTVTFDFALTNLGSVTVHNIQVGDNLNASFAGRPLSGLTLSSTPSLTLNPAYNGISNTNLLIGTNSLVSGAGGRITLTVTVIPGATLSYSNQAVLTATDISGVLIDTDLSDDGTDPDPNHDGDPTGPGENDPTPVVFNENPGIGVSKSLLSSVKNTNGTFTLTYAIQVANMGDVNLLGVQVVDRLVSTFPPPATFTVDSLSSVGFATNVGYNGNSNSNLLAAAQTLVVGAQGTITLTVTVAKNGSPVVSFNNQAAGSGVSPASQIVNASAAVVAILEVPMIDITKQVTALVANGTNFSVTMRIDARNTGDVPLKNVQMTDDLDSTFSGVKSFTLTSKTATGLTINTNYNGVADINLLVGTNTLAVGATGSVFLTVSVVPDLGVTFQNQAAGSGTSTSPGGQIVTDISDPVSILPSLVQGTVYLDYNTNGVFDAGDDTLRFVDVAVTTSSNTTYTVATDTQGHYLVLVPPGSTTININQLDPQFPTNATLTAGSTDPRTVVVPTNGVVTVDTGYVLPPGTGLVTGYVYLDNNDGDGLYNGLFSLGDAPIPNIDVQIIDRNSVTNTVTTDINGYFTRVVLAGKAIVDVITSDPDFPPGRILTFDYYEQGSDPTMVFVPDGGTVSDYTGYLTPDAGTGEIIGIVFIDANTNGVFDVFDTPVLGLDVSITDTNGFVVVSATDSSGFFSLALMPAGPAVVDVVNTDPQFPTNAILTFGSTDPTAVTVLDGGPPVTDNTGYILPAGNGLIEGVVYIDNDHNGLFVTGVDTPIGDITVSITDTNGVVQLVETDFYGIFSAVVTNGFTVVDVDTADPDFPLEYNLTTDVYNQGSNPTTVFVPGGGAAQDNTGFTPLNHIPFPADDIANTKQNLAVSGNVLLNDYLGDTPISSVTILTNGTSGSAVVNLDGSFTYTPNPGFFGVDSFTYQLCDAETDCASATVTITVNPVPTAVNDIATATEDTLFSGSVAGNDLLSADLPNVWTLLTPATNGSVTFSTNGTYTYLPNTNYTGTDAFSYRLCDGDGDCSTALVNISVSAVNDPPVATDDSATTPEDVPITIAPLANDSDLDGDTLIITAATTTNGTVVIVGGTNLLFTPSTNFNGTTTIPYTISDGNGGTNSATVTVIVTPVNDPPVALDDTATTPEDVPITIAPLANDSDLDGDSLTITNATTTNGTVVIVGGTNLLFSPSTNFNGTTTIPYSISDGNGGSASATVTVTVTPVNDPPGTSGAIVADDSYTTPEDTPLTVVAPGVLANDSDVDGDPLTSILVVGPTNGVLTLNTNGSFTYTPALNYNGPDSFTYKANDGLADSPTNAIVSITVTPVNDPPGTSGAIVADDSYTTPEDTTLIVVAPGVLANDSDVDGDPLTSILVTGPTNGVLTLNTNGSFTYTPALNYNGPDSFTYKANDGLVDSPTNAIVSITVTPVNDPPGTSGAIVADDSYTTPEDTTLTVVAPGVLGNDGDVDGDPLTSILVTGPAHGVLTLNTNGSFTYTPALNYNGPDSFTYKANDGLADSPTNAVVSITVTPVNDPPGTSGAIVADDSYTTPEDTTLTVVAPGVLANDGDVDGDPLTSILVTGPTNGVLTLNTNGSFTYTPAINYNGPDSFTYKANDGLADSPTNAVVSITVTPVNDPPGTSGAIVADDSYTTPEDTTLTIVAPGVLANDGDVDGDPLTSILVTGPTNGVLTLNTNGSFTYTPALNYNGPDSFTYKANDGLADSPTNAVVSITVTPVNDPPGTSGAIVADDSYTTPEDTTLTVVAPGVLANDGDVDGDPLTAILVTGPTNGVLTLNTNGSFTYTPALNYNGPDSFIYKANDGLADSPTNAVVSITVTPVNDPPGTSGAIVADDSYTTPEDTTLTVVAPGVLANDGDVDGDPLTSILVTGPTNGVLTLNTNGSFTYTPALNYNGPDSFTYKANDGLADSPTNAVVSITVTPVNDPPGTSGAIVADDSYTTPEDTTLTVVAPGVLANDGDVDGDPLTSILVTGPTNGVLTLNTNGSFTYTPALNYNGPDSFTYKANDGLADSPTNAVVSITVTPVNDPPGTSGAIVADDSYTTPEDTTLTVVAPGVLANDGDVDGDPLTSILVTGPAHGVLTLNTNGSFTYTPVLNYNGPDSFTYKANDGLADSPTNAVVSITVTPVNDPPGTSGAIVADDSYTTPEDTTLTVVAPGVLANDGDVDGDPLTSILVTGPTNGVLTLNTNGSFTYTPALNYNGPDSFTYKANDGLADSPTNAVVSITVTPVNDPPGTSGAVVADDSYTTAEDTTLTVVAPGVLANDSDVDGDPLTSILVTGPAHGVLTLNTNGSFIYTPVLNYNGPDSFTYKANDGLADSPTNAVVSITVTPVNDPPGTSGAIVADDSYTTPEDTTLTVVAPGVLANDGDVDGDPLTAILVTGPAHGVLTLNTNGSFTYTPALNYNGPDSFTYKANDGLADSPTNAVVSITVTPVNDPPGTSGAIVADDSYTTPEDTTLTVVAPGVLANDGDVDGDPLTSILVVGPAHGVLTLNTNGSFTYTPALNYNGPDSFTYKANDGLADSPTNAVVSITVTPVNDPPGTSGAIVADDWYTTPEDTTLTVVAPGVLANDGDVDGDPLTSILVVGPAHGVLTLNTNGSFTYTPVLNYNGPDSFTYKANDGLADSPTNAIVSITVTPVNDPPGTSGAVVADDSYTTPEDTTLTVVAPGVLANDGDVDGDPLTAILVVGPTNGVLTLNTNGSFTYTPALNYNGPDSFTYKANDGLADSPTNAIVSITVTPVNDPPVALDNNYNTAEDTTLNVVLPGVLGNDTDVDGDTLTAVLVSQPTNGTLTFNSNGSFSYLPSLDYLGTDTFTYMANDGLADSGIATVTITIGGANDAPVALNDSYTTPEDTTLNVAAPGALSNDTDVDGDTLNAVLVSQPTHGTLTFNSNGGFSYAPAANYNGTDTFTYQANDGQADSAVATVTITITAANDAPVAVDDSYATPEDTTLTVVAPGVLANDGDVDGDPLTSILVTGPTNGVLTLNTNGSFTYTPALNYNGPDSFTYKANDGLADSPTNAVVSITVTPVNDPPGTSGAVVADDSYTTPEDTTLTVVAPGVLANDGDVDGDPLTSILVTGPAHGVLTLNTNGSFTYTPALNYNGPDSFTYKANDGLADSPTNAVVSITVTPVNDPPGTSGAIVADDSYTTPEDTTLTVVAPGVLANDGDVDGDPLTSILVTGPAHGVLTLNTNGSFTYTPALNYNGPDSFTYKANDGLADSPTNAVVSITVTPVNDPPGTSGAIVADDSYTTPEDTTLTVVAPGVLANDGDVDGDPLTSILVTGPAHGVLTLNTNGSFTYTPALNYNGPDSFIYKANDGQADSPTNAVVSITVTPVNDPPGTSGAIVADDSYTTPEDTTLTVVAPGVLGNDGDVDGDPLTSILVTGPAHGVLTLNTNGSFTYTPALNYNGPDSFTYKANDGLADSPTNAVVSITVTPVNDPPGISGVIVADDSYTTPEDTTLTVVAPGVLANDGDVDGDPLTSILVTGPTHGVLTLNTNGSFIYTPALNYNGPDSFIYKANDGLADSPTNAVVSITVTPVNDPPGTSGAIVADDSYTTPEDTTLTVVAPGVLANDGDVDGDPLTSILVTGPAHGVLTLNTNGSFTYTPALNYNGPDGFIYKANDGQADSPTNAVVSITVTPVNDAPVAVNDSYTTAEDTTLNVALPGVLANDSDVDGDALTAALVSQPTHGVLTLSTNGSFTYTPVLNYNGPDSFTYKANDGQADSPTNAIVSITVTPVNDPPGTSGVIVADDSYTTPEDTTLTVVAPGVLGNDGDVDGDPLTSILVIGPTHGVLTLNTNGSFIYTPALNYNGPDSFTYKANDGLADSPTNAIVSITVTPVNDPPGTSGVIVADDSYTTPEDTTLTVVAPGVLANDGDVDGDPLTSILVTGPTHGVLTLNTNGSFIYTPALNYNGPDSFTYKANDGQADSPTNAVVSITVTPVNDPPGTSGVIVADDSYTTPEDTTLTVVAPGVLANDGDVDGDPLTSILVSGPAHGVLTLNTNGSFTYTPALNYNGPDSFAYKANDGLADSPTNAIVSITVTPVNDPPGTSGVIVADDSYTTPEDTTLTVVAPGVLANDGDVDGDPLTSILVTGPTHGVLTLNTNGSFTYTPALNYNGPDSFAYKANDGLADSPTNAIVSITVTPVNDPPGTSGVIVADDSYTTPEDTTLTVVAPGVLANDGDVDGDPLTSILVTGPAHGVLTLNTNGSFTYTPALNYNGPDGFIYKANDGQADSPTNAVVSITVTPVNDAPVAVNDSYTTAEDTTLNVALPGVLANDSDVDGDALTAALVSQPTHGVLTLNTNGSFTYTPVLNYNGPDSFTYKANDGQADSPTNAIVSITVTPVNDPPGTSGVIVADDSYTTPEDTTLTVVAPGVLANDGDVDGDALTSILVSGPAHGVLTLNTNGSFTYTPALNYNGPDSFIYKANDGQADSPTNAVVSITVTPVNDAPVAVNDSYTTPEDTILNVPAIGVLTNDSDVDGDALSAILVSQPTHGVLTLNTNGGFTYLPATNYLGGDSFTYQANDGALNSGIATVSITIGGVNDAPVAVDDSYTTPEDTQLTVNAAGILANDSDLDGDALTAILVSQPTHGVLTLNTNGGFTYVPTTNYTGPDSFTYQANDGALNSGIATVSITVTGVNDPPVAVNDTYTTAEDTLLTVIAAGVLGNDSDVDGDALSAILVSQPTHGVLTLSTNGGFTYLPATNYLGGDSFTYQANDGALNSGIATVSITIGGVNDAPVAVDDSYTTPEDTQLTVNAAGILANDSDLDGDALTAILVSQPTHGVLTLNTNGGFSYVPATNYTGPDSFTYQANDGALNSGVATVSITITGANDPPVAVNDSYTTLEDTILSVPAVGVLTNDTDVDGDALSATLVSQPTHGVLTLNTNGGFSYLPATNYNGLDSFTYQANDGALNSGIATVSITITAVNDAPVALDDSYATPEDTALTVITAGILANDSDVDGDALSAVLVSQPTHGVLTLNANGGFSYLPATNYLGSDSFTYRANDGQADSGIATVTITIGGVNDAPVAVDDSYTTPEDTQLTVIAAGILANDSDLDGDTLSAILVSQPTHGVLTLSTNGGFSYLPATNYNGPDSFTYQANDGALNSGVATVSITITGVNDPPVAVDDSYTTPEDTILNVPAAGVLTNDTDVDGDALSAILVSQPTHGVLTLSTNGGFSYLPATNYLGSDSFTYRANDGQADSGIATVTITITGANDAPVAVDDSYSTLEDTTLNVPAIGVLANDSDMDGDTLSAILVSQPTHGVLTLNTDGGLSYLPATNYSGSDSFTYKANDGQADSGIATVSITIVPEVITCLPLSYDTPQMNWQTTLFEQKLRVSNPTQNTLTAVRVSITGLREGTRVYNASGDVDGVPFVTFNAPLNPGETAEITVEYYVLDRRAPQASFCATSVLKSTPTQPEGTPVTIDRMMWLADGSFMIEFAAVPGRVYTIQYADEMGTWKTVTPSGSSDSNRIQWIDNGPPKTESYPKQGSTRFYRVITGQ